MRNAASIFACLLVFMLPALAQEGGEDSGIPAVTYPRLAASAENVEGFVPRGWKLESQVIGDLNADARGDLVFVLRMTDPRNIIDNAGGPGEQSFDSNPRILAAAFKRDNDFELALANHTLIPRRTDPIFNDALGENGGIELMGRTIAVKFHAFASAGSWDAGSRTLRFRWQKGAFQLIGWDYTSIHRGSGEVTEVSLNFLTGEVVEGKGTIEDDVLKTKTRTIAKRPLLTIDEVGNGMIFEPKL
jgi:hypothetical protein